MTCIEEYRAFIASRALTSQMRGFEPRDMNRHMKAHQIAAVDFALRRGASAMFLDTGLGKSLCELEWARQVADDTGMPVLILTPLAVAAQMVREGQKFGIDARQIREQSEVGDGIMVANYERLPKLDAGVFGGVVLDESSILKSFAGRTRNMLMDAFRDVRFKLAATATPSPNDHMELGNHAEFLSVMRQQEMLSKWFINDTSTASQNWRLKGHTVEDFWAWVASWSRCATLPSDLGGDDDGYILPEIDRKIHHVEADRQQDTQGMLFRIPELSATSFHKEKKLTMRQRCEKVFQVLFSELCSKLAETILKLEQCHGSQNTQSAFGNLSEAETQLKEGTQDCNLHTEFLNLTMIECCQIRNFLARFVDQSTKKKEERDFTSIIATRTDTSEDCSAPRVTRLLEKCVMMLQGCDQQYDTLKMILLDPVLVFCETNDEQDYLEELSQGISISVRGSQSEDVKERGILEWCDGKLPWLISKSSIVGFGMNFQHCAFVIFASINFSYEKFYQAIRRVHRFGQKRRVECAVVISDTERSIWGAINGKAEKHAEMKRRMADAMKRAQSQAEVRVRYDRPLDLAFPDWIRTGE